MTDPAVARDGTTPPHVTSCMLSITLAGLFILAMLVRLQGITYGLPMDFYAPDEVHKTKAISAFRHGTFTYRPKQPSLLLNSSYLFQFGTRPLKREFLSRISIPTGMSHGKLESAFLIWSSRLWMALIGSATCVLLFFVGRRLWDDAAGLFAAFFYTLWPLPIATTHYVKEDTPLAFFTTLTVFFCLALIKYGRLRDYLLAGLSCGLSFGAKYPGALTLLALLGAHLLRTPESHTAMAGKNLVSSHLLPLGSAFAAALLGFVLTSPQHLAQIAALSENLVWQSEYLLRGHWDGVRVEALPQWFSFYLRTSLWPGIGGIGLLTAVCGWIAGIVVARDSTQLRMVTLVGVWMVAYYLAAESMPSKPYPFFARYVLPVVPLLALGAGIGCAVLWRSLVVSDSALSYLRAALLVLIAVGTILPALLFAWHVLPDTRDTAMVWLDHRSGTLISQRYSQYPVKFRDGALGKWHVLPPSGCLPKLERVLKRVEGPVYVALNSFNTDRWLAHPEANPKCTSRIKQVMQEGKLELEVRKHFAKFGFHNPDIEIYRLK